MAENRLGVDSNRAAFDSVGYAVYVDGAPDAAITGNQMVAHGYGAVVTTGMQQAQAEDEGDDLLLATPRHRRRLHDGQRQRNER